MFGTTSDGDVTHHPLLDKEMGQQKNQKTQKGVELLANLSHITKIKGPPSLHKTQRYNKPSLQRRFIYPGR